MPARRELQKSSRVPTIAAAIQCSNCEKCTGGSVTQRVSRGPGGWGGGHNGGIRGTGGVKPPNPPINSNTAAIVLEASVVREARM